MPKAHVIAMHKPEKHRHLTMPKASGMACDQLQPIVIEIRG